MSGFFGAVSKEDCVSDVFYGTDYHSHLGTKRGGMAVYSSTKGFQRAIHSLENNYFRTKFENDAAGFEGSAGIGCISDTEAQPLVIYSKLGRFAISTRQSASTQATSSLTSASCASMVWCRAVFSSICSITSKERQPELL